jgi:hypothetical protein
MRKPISKVRLKKPIYLGLCPKPQFRGNSNSWRLCHLPRTGKTNPNL